MPYETLKYEVKEKIAHVTLNRPDQGNALNEQMHHELDQVWRRTNQDDDVWATVVQGAGKDFCLGEDAEEIAAAYRKGTKVERWLRDETWQRKAAAGLEPVFGWPEPGQGLPGKPLVAVVHGRCHGAGLMFVAHADFTIAAEDAEFCLPNVHQGTAPIHELIVLTRTMPRIPVLSLALLGRHEKWSAERACQLGLIIETTPREKLSSRLAELLDLLVNRSAPLAVRASRISWWQTFNSALHSTHGLSSLHYPYMAEVRVVSEDAKEGPRSFAEKRRAQWKAR